MSQYPVTVRRCQHIKVNGIQCGSPAMRDERRCFFHEQSLVRSRRDLLFNEPGISQLDSLEDANSIQLALAEVMRLVITDGIDRPTASLLLRILRTAALNVKFTSFEPKPTQVVVDPNSVDLRLICSRTRGIGQSIRARSSNGKCAGASQARRSFSLVVCST